MVSMGSPAGPCVPGVSTALSPVPCALCCWMFVWTRPASPPAPGDTDRPPSPELGVLQAHIQPWNSIQGSAECSECSEGLS